MRVEWLDPLRNLRHSPRDERNYRLEQQVKLSRRGASFNPASYKEIAPIMSSVPVRKHQFAAGSEVFQPMRKRDTSRLSDICLLEG